jgi:hypothetical protein
VSALAIVLIAVAVVLVVLFVGGLVTRTRRTRAHEVDYARHIAAADRALEEARAADKGWDRVLLEEAARRALAEQRAGWPYDSLHLVLVDDRPGVTDDRAHLVARGDEGEVRIVLIRRDEGWVPEQVG